MTLKGQRLICPRTVDAISVAIADEQGRIMVPPGPKAQSDCVPLVQVTTELISERDVVNSHSRSL